MFPPHTHIVGLQCYLKSCSQFSSSKKPSLWITEFNLQDRDSLLLLAGRRFIEDSFSQGDGKTR